MLRGSGLLAVKSIFCFAVDLVCPIDSAFFSGMGGIQTKFRSTQFYENALKAD
jgi:hypothetical protein